MENCRWLLKSALVAVVLVAAVQSGSAAEKLASCCKAVSKQEITTPILGYLVQRAKPPCVQAVIFQTEDGFFCSQLNAEWVRPKIIAFEKAKAEAKRLSLVSSSPVSLLSIITSTASPPSSSSSSSSSLPPSSSSSLPPSSSTPLSSSSSSSPPPSSSSRPTFPSTSEKPADETFAERGGE